MKKEDLHGILTLYFCVGGFNYIWFKVEAIIYVQYFNFVRNYYSKYKRSYSK